MFYVLKYFLRLNYLEMHRTYGCSENPGRTRPLCELCGKKFCQPQKLKVHMRRVHSGNEDNRILVYNLISLSWKINYNTYYWICRKARRLFIRISVSNMREGVRHQTCCFTASKRSSLGYTHQGQWRSWPSCKPC